MKVITNPISNVPVQPKSHTLGWATVWQDQLDAAIDHKCSPRILEADVVYIDHGANFGGTLNLFGGATKELYDRINLVCACKNIVSLDWDMPNYGEMLRGRIGNKTTYEGLTEEWCDKVSARLSNVPSLKQQDLEYDDVILGDSHTISFSDKDTICLRNDGKTLHGVLTAGLDTMLRGVVPKNKLTLCFGSIDIRHHLMRHGPDAVDKLVEAYVKQGSELADKYNCEVYYCYPVPVEYEDRKVPKTGYYKKTPFYGTREERAELTQRFISKLEELSEGKTVAPPSEWYTMDPEKYAKTYMEFGGSFHIAPPFYKRNNWGTTCIM